jgi:hypothetical protein
MTTDTYDQPAPEEIIPTLRSGLRWLYRSTQPDDAIVTHLGLYLPALATRHFSFIPRGYHGHPVITVQVVEPRYRDDAPPANPLAPGELEDLARVLADLGVEVDGTWNGHPGVNGSLRLAEPCHPTLADAVNRYRAGCQTHTKFYGGKAEGDVFCKCGWYATGHARLIKPSPPAPRPSPVPR